MAKWECTVTFRKSWNYYNHIDGMYGMKYAKNLVGIDLAIDGSEILTWRNWTTSVCGSVVDSFM